MSIDKDTQAPDAQLGSVLSSAQVPGRGYAAAVLGACFYNAVLAGAVVLLATSTIWKAPIGSRVGFDGAWGKGVIIIIACSFLGTYLLTRAVNSLRCPALLAIALSVAGAILCGLISREVGAWIETVHHLSSIDPP